MLDWRQENPLKVVGVPWEVAKDLDDDALRSYAEKLYRVHAFTVHPDRNLKGETRIREIAAAKTRLDKADAEKLSRWRKDLRLHPLVEEVIERHKKAARTAWQLGKRVVETFARYMVAWDSKETGTIFSGDWYSIALDDTVRKNLRLSLTYSNGRRPVKRKPKQEPRVVRVTPTGILLERNEAFQICSLLGCLPSGFKLIGDGGYDEDDLTAVFVGEKGEDNSVCGRLPGSELWRALPQLSPKLHSGYWLLARTYETSADSNGKSVLDNSDIRLIGTIRSIRLASRRIQSVPQRPRRPRTKKATGA